MSVPDDWEHFAHGADIGVRGRGSTLGAAFAHAALALTAVVTDPAAVRRMGVVRVDCEAADPELLFVAWLNEVVYQMATRRMLFGDFEVTVRPPRVASGGRDPSAGETATDASGATTAVLDGDGVWRLEARLQGEPVDVARHQPAVEVKGATFTALQVAQAADGLWVAGCVVDV